MKTRDAPPAPAPRPSGSAAKPGRKPSPEQHALAERFRSVLAAGGNAGPGEGESLEESSLAEDARSTLRAPGREARDERADAPSEAGASEPDALTVGALAGQAGPMATPLTTAALAQAAPTAGTFHPALFAQLLEKHVRQLLVAAPESGAARGKPQIMLNLTDAALPGTSITLERTEQGWQIQSRTGSSEAFRTMQAMAPRLKERFAERGLGGLEFDVKLNDE